MRLHKSRPRTAALVTLLGVSLVAGVASYVPEAQAKGPKAPAPVVQPEKSTPGKNIVPAPAEQTAMPPYAPADPVWPAPTVTAAGGSAAGLKAAGGDSPVSLSFVSKGKSAQPAGATVEVLGQDESKRLGVAGVVLRVSRTDAQATAAKAKVSVDYSKFAAAYGGDWSSRLRVVELGCAADGKCAEKPLVANSNDTTAKVVSGELDLAAVSPARAKQASTQFTTLAVTAAASGSTGSYAATTLSPSSSWNVGTQTGDFSWNYPFRVPPGTNGPRPELSIGYSSGSVDGQIASTNNQASWIGQGHSLEAGYIERKYVSCSDDMTPQSNNKTKTGDLCWKSDNAFLSLGAHSGELFKLSSVGNVDTFRLKNDDGSLIQRKYGAANGAVGSKDDSKKGEYWEVTTADGTKYFFGLNPSLTNGQKSDSVSTVPVFGNHEGDPCYETAYKTSYCQQAWRWSVDKVVDLSKNLMTYRYIQETNYYGRNNNEGSSLYQRAGYPEKIDYGKVADATETTKAAPAQVTFEVAERCVPSGAVTCDPAQLTEANASKWPDTPFDQICTSATTCPNRTSPSFFTRKRLATINTGVLNSSNRYSPVDSWTLVQQFPNADTPALWLASITHKGMAGTPIANPSVTFIGSPKPNRVDATGDGAPAMNKYRVTKINSESGQTTNVNYSDPDCTPTSKPADAAANTRRCFPVYWTIEGGEDPTVHWFHKYVVNSVTLEDRVTDGPDMPTYYEYLGTPAWHFDNSQFTIPKQRTWGEWRGYGKVNVRTGAPGAQTQTQSTYFRGMDDDYLNREGTSRRNVAVTDSENGTYPDSERFNGFVREQITYNGSGGEDLNGTISTPWTSSTGSAGGYTALLLRTQKTETKTRTSPGSYRRTEALTTFDGRGRTLESDDRGDIATTSDDRCTRYTYNANDALWLLGSVSREEKVSVACTATPTRPAEVISDERSYYDGADSLTDAPTRGLLTKVDTMSRWTTGPVYEQRVRTAYDSVGRVIETYDALNRRTSKVEFTPTTTGPVTQTKTTDAKGFVNISVIAPEWGASTVEIDANQRRTDLAYDGLGRLTSVWLPDRPRSGTGATTASMIFSYSVPNNAPNVVTTQQLKPDGTYKASRTLLDGFLRPRQVQTPSATAVGRILADTKYDERGNVVFKDGPYHDSNSQPNNVLFVPAQENIPARTKTTYDGANRATLSQFLVDNAEKTRTTTMYSGGATTVVPPEGSTTTTTLVDARGKTTELRQYKGRAATGDYDATKYTYTDDDQVETVTNAAGSVWSFGYDIRGRQVRADDPDKGTTTSTYDAVDRLTSSKDARGQQLFFSYDELDRKTAVRSGAADGPVVTSWIYDTLGKGMLTSSTRTVNGNDYVSAVTGYDSMGRPTGSKTVIPASEGELKGTYTTATTYNPDGSINTADLPKVPGLPDETIGLHYDANGNLDQMGGWQAYVSGVTYDVYGTPVLNHVGQETGRTAYQQFTYERGTRRLTEMQVSREGIGQPDDTFSYTYDDSANVKSISHKYGATVDLQCFTTDYLRRTTEAWTPGTNCSDPRSATTLGGPAPYWQSYTYDVAGNRRTLTDHKTNGDTKSTYAYPTSTAPRPHAVTDVTSAGPGGTSADSYGYDASGNMATRVVGGDTDNFTWDAEGHLSKVAGPAGDTTFVYDAEGTRLIRHDPKGASLFLASAEIRWDKGPNQSVGSTRYYDFNGKTIAMRTTSAAVEYLMPDSQGTASVSFDGVTNTISRRLTDPYGNPRGTQSPTWESTSRGFVNGVNDASTGLTHLGAREYDPKLGRFISVDPLIDLTDPMTMNAYAYGNNAPATFSDPDGLKAFYDDDPYDDGVHAPRVRPQTQVDPETRQKQIEVANRITEHWEKQEKAKKVIKEVVKALVKIAADELGITDALNCFTEGDIGGCIATGVTVLSSFVGGIAAKLATKYIFKLGKFGKLLGNIWSLVEKAGGAVKEWVGSSKALKCEIGNSFVPGTRVLMADGSEKPIEELKLGDSVLATDAKTGATSAQPVVRTIVGQGSKDLVDIAVSTVKDGARQSSETITATSRHPFYVRSLGRWVDADKLVPGDRLTSQNSEESVAVIARQSYTRMARVYNLTIGALHTYYVLAGSTPVLVHNCGTGELTFRPGEDDIHYNKHVLGVLKNGTSKDGGADMPEFLDKQDYVAGARDLLGGEAGPGVLEGTRGTDTLRFDTGTGAFGVKTSEGIVRTFFRPAGGEDYYRGIAGLVPGNF
ncbi:polymorphic toxin-type HINT domain-containing protein [Kribbella sp. NBC_01505]|uniref:polymorphic toxin-type HINT domain-containing protein n=1 Tax=Kribbella sp. NBC_01505 TaxID=2903580 RepID=UPI00386CED21